MNSLLQVESEWSESLQRETAEVLAREAIVEDGLATWPADAGGPLAPASGSGIRLQWCHGAPGMVATAAPYLDEELLLAGAELTWRAGAHREEKGAGLCHGTSGNGYALLKTFERTGDERWLERARSFAVHALAQVERRRPAGTRSSPAVSASPSSRRRASTPMRASRCSTAGTNLPRMARTWAAAARRGGRRARAGGGAAAGCSRGCATRSAAAAAR